MKWSSAVLVLGMTAVSARYLPHVGGHTYGPFIPLNATDPLASSDTTINATITQAPTTVASSNLIRLNNTVTSNSGAPSATPTMNAEPIVFDRFTVIGLEASVHHHDRDISFSVMDRSTSPPAITSCHIHWHRHQNQPRGPIKCENGWFTTSLLYFDNPQRFGLQINHAYGEKCTECNDETNEQYNGDVGTCTFQLGADEMSNSSGSGHHYQAKAESVLDCFVDFDDVTL